MNVVHGVHQTDSILIDHVPQNWAALADARNRQRYVLIGHGLENFLFFEVRSKSYPDMAATAGLMLASVWVRLPKITGFQYC